MLQLHGLKNTSWLLTAINARALMVVCKWRLGSLVDPNYIYSTDAYKNTFVSSSVARNVWGSKPGRVVILPPTAKL